MGEAVNGNLISKKVSHKFTYLSFIMACLVVVRHAVGIEIYNISGSFLYYFESFMSELTDLIVPMFFVISGYLFYRNYTNDQLLKKYKKRFFSLVIPFIIWNAVAYIFYLVITRIPVIADNMNLTVTFSIKELFTQLVFSSYNITWFLLNLIIYTYLFPLIFPLIKRHVIVPVLFYVILYMVGIFGKFGGNYFLYATLYLFGMSMGIYGKKLVEMKYKFNLRIISLVLLLGTIFLRLFIDMPYQVYYLYRAFQTVLMWIVFDFLQIDTKPSFIFSISFFIYCSHSMILESLEKIFLIVFKNTLVGAYLDFFLCPVITVVLIYIIGLLLRKIPKLWKIINGGRGNN